MVDPAEPAGRRAPDAACQITARLVSAFADALGHRKAERAAAHEALRIVETHISWVILAGRLAYKIKKPIRLDFLDFSTLARRRQACEDELRLNRRTAPELYLRVVPLVGTPDAPRIGLGAEGRVRDEPIEFAVEMRRFDPDALFARRLDQGRIDGPLVDALAERIARFHASLAPAAPPVDAAAADDRPPAVVTARRNLAELLADALTPPLRRRIEALATWLDARLPALEPRLLARARDGFVRECHGDLHLANVALVDGRPVLFDCLEFDLALRTIDVLDETAFAFMDFLAHRRRDLAFRFLNAYLEITGDYAGVPCLPFFTLHRALVRAKVASIRFRQAGVDAAVAADLAADVERHVAVAETQTIVRDPLLVVTCGLSGSGKTTVGGALVEALPALRIRSDVERKRLAGLAAEARTDSPIGGGLYDAAASERTYDRLESLARILLGAGTSVVVDAAFLLRRDRARFRDLARAVGARFRIVLCDAPIETLRSRVEARSAAGRDASEAGAAVLDHQLTYYEPPEGDEAAETDRIETTQTPETVRSACAAIADRAMRERAD
ncbi:MAG: AAA family ATPase [Myxococcota bacterium]